MGATHLQHGICQFVVVGVGGLNEPGVVPDVGEQNAGEAHPVYFARNPLDDFGVVEDQP
jgi:hypothetical protein